MFRIFWNSCVPGVYQISGRFVFQQQELSVYKVLKFLTDKLEGARTVSLTLLIGQLWSFFKSDFETKKKLPPLSDQLSKISDLDQSGLSFRGQFEHVYVDDNNHERIITESR